MRLLWKKQEEQIPQPAKGTGFGMTASGGGARREKGRKQGCHGRVGAHKA